MQRGAIGAQRDRKLGYFDLEQKTLQPLDNPFGTRLSPKKSARHSRHFGHELTRSYIRRVRLAINSRHASDMAHVRFVP
jgi:hypothetical protein